MAVDPGYVAVMIDVSVVDDHRQPAFRITHGLTPSTEPRKDRTGRREFLLPDPDGNQLAFFAK